MTDRQEVRAKSMELALRFMGLAYKLPIKTETTLEDDEPGALKEVFGKAEWLSQKFENFIKERSPYF